METPFAPALAFTSSSIIFLILPLAILRSLAEVLVPLLNKFNASESYADKTDLSSLDKEELLIFSCNPLVSVTTFTVISSAMV